MIDASTEPATDKWDLGSELHYRGQIVYANVGRVLSGQDATADELPSLLLCNRSPHEPWPSIFRFYIPPGGRRSISLRLVIRPFDPPPPLPLGVALQGVDAFHRHQFGVAAVMLGAAVEATLRAKLEPIYSDREVELKDVGFAGLIERARLVLQPRLGSILIGNLKKLANEGRNQAAHGNAYKLTSDQVAGWMVDVAALYEWAHLAKDVADPQA